MGVIYVRTNLINGMQYIGRSVDFSKRESAWNSINRKTPYSNDILEEDRKKYGIEKFETTILKECDDDELDKWERHYIEAFDTIYPKGYNLESGGVANFKINDISRQKMSDAKKGKSHTEEWKKSMSEKQKGEGNGFYGKHHSEVSKKKMSESRKGHTPWNKGKKMSEEQRQKNIESSKKKCKGIYQYTLDGELVRIWESSHECERNGFNRSCILKCCRGKQKEHKGYKWSYTLL